MAPSSTETTAVIQIALKKLDVSKHRIASNTRVMQGKWTRGVEGAAAAYQTADKKEILAVINPPAKGVSCKSTLIYSTGMKESVELAIKAAKQEWEKNKYTALK